MSRPLTKDDIAALRTAAAILQNLDVGDPSTETGWADDELLDAWLCLNAVIDEAETA